MIARKQPLERLIEADPVWVGSGPNNTVDPNRCGIGVQFDCPIHEDCLIYVPMDPPLDNAGPFAGERGWRRTGDTFETLTLSPSIRRIPRGPEDCAWHGFVRGGRFETCGDAR